jgi:hypothetical protein
MLFSGEKRRINEVRYAIETYKRMLTAGDVERFEAIIGRLPPSGFTSEFYDLCLDGDGATIEVEIDGRLVIIRNKKFLAFLRGQYSIEKPPTTSVCDRCGQDYAGNFVGASHSWDQHGHRCGGTIVESEPTKRFDTIPDPIDAFVNK